MSANESLEACAGDEGTPDVLIFWSVDALERGVDQPLEKYEGPNGLALGRRLARCGIDPALRRESRDDFCAGVRPAPMAAADAEEDKGIVSVGVVAGDAWDDLDTAGPGAPRLLSGVAPGKRDGTVPALRRLAGWSPGEGCG